MRFDRRSGGFTLLEMLIVVAILGMMLGLVLLRGPLRSPGLDLRAAAEGAVQALRSARALAIADGRPVRLVVDSAHHRYVTDGDALRTSAIPPDVALRGPARGIAFAPDGSSSGGAIVLATANRTATVSVDWLTGRVRMIMAAER